MPTTRRPSKYRGNERGKRDTCSFPSRMTRFILTPYEVHLSCCPPRGRSSVPTVARVILSLGTPMGASFYFKRATEIHGQPLRTTISQVDEFREIIKNWPPAIRAILFVVLAEKRKKSQRPSCVRVCGEGQGGGIRRVFPDIYRRKIPRVFAHARTHARCGTGDGRPRGAKPLDARATLFSICFYTAHRARTPPLET